jgi:hypothetical protein
MQPLAVVLAASFGTITAFLPLSPSLNIISAWTNCLAKNETAYSSFFLISFKIIKAIFNW